MEHIPGKENVIADAISRNYLQVMKEAVSATLCRLRIEPLASK